MTSRIRGRAMALPLVALACLACVVVPSCSSPESLGQGFVADSGPPLGPLGAEDASSDASRDGLTNYCPSDQCPPGFTTCPNSLFPCDVDLRTDLENCGACGSSCQGPTTAETFECVEGRCALRCEVTLDRMDCDGIVDNGCETSPSDSNNCGACGTVCSDPAKPCIQVNESYQCGCDAGMIPCGDEWYMECVDPKTSDGNCGACGNACDPAGPGGDLPTNTYYGCVDSQCGNLKCQPFTADCDGDMGNGCEASLTSNDHCGSCGNACPDGKDCFPNALGIFECLCPTGQTYCNGECVDFATDADNCGSCGYTCNPSNRRESIGVCTFGTCSRRCVTGRADCNGNAADDCETNTNSDPHNCGGCGIVCDAIAGQACVGGQCVVAPCEPDGGPVAR